MKLAGEFNEIRRIIEKEKKIVKEMMVYSTYLKNSGFEERKMIYQQILLLKDALNKENENLLEEIQKVNLIKPLPEKGESVKEENKIEPKQEELKKEEQKKRISDFNILQKKPSFIERIGIEKIYKKDELKPTPLEKETIKRIKNKKREEEIKKIAKDKPDEYVRIANQFFSNFSKKLIKMKVFTNLEEDLIKSNLKYTQNSYISMCLLSTVIAFIIGMLLAFFFLFFRISPDFPIIFLAKGNFLERLTKVFWIPIFSPILTFIIIMVYPSLEKSSAELNINQELPFAAINMSAISGSMIDPSKIFSIIIMTNDYPYLEKEFKKLINQINIYGYDFVSALRDAAIKSPSKKLSELFNGLATTINSGGNLPEFFEKRAQTLLFEYGLEKEKKTKAAETFMDIYISIVIAAPMILMILLMMMKISGLGISLSTGTITLIMVLAVTVINIVFLTFLHLKK